MRLLFWRRRKNNDDAERQLRDSKKRLKETQERWPEVEKAQHRLEQIIEQALRGGQA